MKLITSLIFLASAFVTTFAAQAAQPIINLSVGGELAPGVYGQVQFGNAPPPPVLYAQPSVIVHQPDEGQIEPMYLHVPPRHAKNWRKYCREYNACNRRVFFVKSAEYEPGYRESRGRDSEHRIRRDEADRHDNRENNNEHRHRDDGNRDNADRGERRHDRQD